MFEEQQNICQTLCYYSHASISNILHARSPDHEHMNLGNREEANSFQIMGQIKLWGVRNEVAICGKRSERMLTARMANIQTMEPHQAFSSHQTNTDCKRTRYGADHKLITNRMHFGYYFHFARSGVHMIYAECTSHTVCNRNSRKLKTCCLPVSHESSSIIASCSSISVYNLVVKVSGKLLLSIVEWERLINDFVDTCRHLCQSDGAPGPGPMVQQETIPSQITANGKNWQTMHQIVFTYRQRQRRYWLKWANRLLMHYFHSIVIGLCHTETPHTSTSFMQLHTRTRNAYIYVHNLMSTNGL